MLTLRLQAAGGPTLLLLYGQEYVASQTPRPGRRDGTVRAFFTVAGWQWHPSLPLTLHSSELGTELYLTTVGLGSIVSQVPGKDQILVSTSNIYHKRNYFILLFPPFPYQ